MLFETIFGPDAESIYLFLKKQGKNVSVEKVYNAFAPKLLDGEQRKTKNVEDALSFLKSTGLVEGDEILSPSGLPFEDFKISLLYSLRNIETNEDYPVRNELDRHFFRILTKLFVEPNKFYLSSTELHKQANALEGMPGGITKTKLSAWRRVMGYLGLGFRDTTGGFYCVYDDEVVRKILFLWPENDGIIQNLMETHFDKFLPWLDHKRKMSKICQESFRRLVQQNVIRLSPKQDLSAVPYFPENYRGIELIQSGF